MTDPTIWVRRFVNSVKPFRPIERFDVCDHIKLSPGKNGPRGGKS